VCFHPPLLLKWKWKVVVEKIDKKIGGEAGKEAHPHFLD